MKSWRTTLWNDNEAMITNAIHPKIAEYVSPDNINPLGKYNYSWSIYKPHTINVTEGYYDDYGEWVRFIPEEIQVKLSVNYDWRIGQVWGKIVFATSGDADTDAELETYDIPKLLEMWDMVYNCNLVTWEFIMSLEMYMDYKKGDLLKTGKSMREIHKFDSKDRDYQRILGE